MIVLIMLFAFSASNVSAYGQDRENTDYFKWEFSLGGISYYVSKANYWNFGPELVIQYALNKKWGVYGGISYPYKRMAQRGYGFREGFPFDIGASLSTGDTNLVLKYGLGISYIFGSDSDGSIHREFGAHISGHLSFWFTDNIGAYLRGILRLWLGDREGEGATSPSLSAGIGFRF